ncbi:hypothetical protein DXC62_10145 [Ruminococcaceae bacterium TF06-43]|nr:hypothetical protein DXC62_10145 [Ruminococcaceae bacterium TF06-43]
MKKGRFLWSAHRITERQKAGKARNIKGKQLKNSRSTVSKLHVARLSSPSANLLKIPETQGSRGFFLCEDMPLFAAEGRKGLGLLRGFLRLPSCFQVTNEVTRRVFSKSKMQHKERRILSNASFFMPK